ncbi:amino acid ABC transporter substrate-binding protein, PAAT family (TC 3.A.1.3.-) [Pseudogulbenkiania subflava DSM 22618]|uniref:Amino acid ABC transporter substrate-binding protein, PAAT family (TC 3.A.1.3.-) n=2 Tax=Pseudogulbenkiania subflava TaxID=451637 RepID=A0A1Y6BK53_9NEIS|nr:amino acid ABC transporter substrate-binding protein, PAAT family (TC 3.A.1.3.-) [Pseudogulbenkiania subflava DSM 22618]
MILAAFPLRFVPTSLPRQRRLARYIATVGVLLIAAGAMAAPKLSLYTEEWPPMTFTSGKGTPDGMAVEVVNELLHRTGQSNSIAVVPWMRGYKLLLTRPNVMLFTVGRNAERERNMTLLGPIAMSSTVLLARSEDVLALQALGSDILKREVAAYQGSIFESTARNKGFSSTRETGSSEEGARMLLAKRVDLWVEGNIAVAQTLQRLGIAPDRVSRVMTLDSLDLYLAFSRGTDRNTILQWQTALRDMKKDGTFQAIHQRWFPGEPAPPQVVRIGLEP